MRSSSESTTSPLAFCYDDFLVYLASGMSFFFRANAHMVNYVAMSLAFAVPLIYFVSKNSPEASDLENEIRSKNISQLSKIDDNAEKMNSFWKGARNSKDMDAVYQQLLRSGAGGVKRLHTVEGKIAQAEKDQEALKKKSVQT
jgi:hypothetical protein